MYSSLSIAGFRCFAKLEVSGLRRINLLTGHNNVGKTSVLEALFLLAGGFNASLPLRVNALRGMEMAAPSAAEQFGWLFHGQHTGIPIEISANRTGTGGDRLRISLTSSGEYELLRAGQNYAAGVGSADAGQVVVSISQSQPLTAGPDRRDLVLEYQPEGQPVVVHHASWRPDGIRVDNPQQMSFRPAVFLSTRARPAAEDAQRLSVLQRERTTEKVVRALKPVEPELTGLSILVVGGQPIIHADLQRAGLVPVPMLGEGMGRLLSLVLAVLTTPNGLVLIDEIDNGLHHSVVESVWKVVGAAAREANSQVFATTHSRECYEAAYRALADDPEQGLNLVQLFRLPAGVVARSLAPEQAAAAVENGIDLR